MIVDVQYSQYVIDHDMQNRIVAADEGFTRITGYTQLDVKEENITLYDLVPEDVQSAFVQQLMQKLGDKQKACFNHPILCKDGSVTHVSSFVESYRNDVSEHLCFRFLMTDMCVDKSLEQQIALVRKNFEESERKLQEKTDLLEGILNNLVGSVGMFEYDPGRDTMNITAMHNGEKSIIELADFVQNLENSRYIHMDDIEMFRRNWGRAAVKPTKTSLDFRTKLFSSGYIWYRATCVSLSNEEGDGVSRIVGCLINIQSDVINQQTLNQTDAVDTLTKLFNKDFTQAKINKHLYENPESNALMLIDIDNFKEIDDTFGHSYGDAVLKDVSKVMRANFRVNFDILGRIGWHEFVILLNNPPSQNVVVYKAKQLCREICHTYEDNDKEVTVSSSIGIAFYPEHGTDFETLYKKADKALHKAKEEGQNGYAIYDPAVKEGL